MKDWRKTLVSPDGTIRDIVETLSLGGQQVALIVGDDDMLLGMVTDGDVRRGLLAGKTLEDSARAIMNTDFFAAWHDDDDATVLANMREREISQVPLVDDRGRLVGLRTLMGMTTVQPRRDNPVVLMAGGLGQRLRPLTEDCPKPLLSVGGKPLLETILRQFVEHGFHRFYLSVNYRAEMVEEYFGDGSRFGVEIDYLREDEQLGTAGALGLLPEPPREPIFVMNGDLLTRVDFPGMLDFHRDRGASATMAVRSFEMQVPYGVVEVDNHQIVNLQEKPVHQFFVNAGIYVLSPEAVSIIEKGQYLDMPRLFERLKEQGRPTAAFPIHEYWMDIGRKQDFDQANFDYDMHFCITNKG